MLYLLNAGRKVRSSASVTQEFVPVSTFAKLLLFAPRLSDSPFPFKRSNNFSLVLNNSQRK